MATLIQLDDLSAEAAAAIGRHAFMVLRSGVHANLERRA
jgi:hypothetical protein